jgi:hypothetical protein
MKNSLSFLLLWSVLWPQISQLRAEKPLPSTASAKDGTAIPLFNGKDLSGFYTWLRDTQYEDPREVFSVVDGVIRISGDGFGYLATEGEYSDYHLSFEFKWGSRNWRGRENKARDSGVFLHATGSDGNSVDGNGAFMAALECQIMEGCLGDILLIRGLEKNGTRIHPGISFQADAKPDEAGQFFWNPEGKQRTLKKWGRLNWIEKSRRWKDIPGFKSETGANKPIQEWVRVECNCVANNLIIRINGKVVNQANRVFPDRGKILFQCEGSEIFYRRIELKTSGKNKIIPENRILLQ